MTRAPLAGRLIAVAVFATLTAACSAGGSPTPSVAATSGTPTGSAPAAAGDCPTAQPDALAAGEERVVRIDTEKGSIEITVEADLSPIAAGNFVALAECGFYEGVVFHRLVPGFVIQGGDPTGTGTGGPGYTIQDEPVTATYGRATVAMARSGQPNSVGSQFFIVLDDAARQALADPRYNNYQIIGTVTSGMETVDAIAAMPNNGPPNNEALEPVAMTDVTVAQP